MIHLQTCHQGRSPSLCPGTPRRSVKSCATDLCQALLFSVHRTFGPVETRTSSMSNTSQSDGLPPGYPRHLRLPLSASLLTLFQKKIAILKKLLHDRVKYQVSTSHKSCIQLQVTHR